jgi:hypothetical protein
MVDLHWIELPVQPEAGRERSLDESTLVAALELQNVHNFSSKRFAARHSQAKNPRCPATVGKSIRAGVTSLCLRRFRLGTA